MSIRHSILRFFKPLQMWMQSFGASEPLMTATAVKRIMHLARPGDTLLSYENQRFTSMFIDGEWDHAAAISSRMTVIEAVGDDYYKNSDGIKVNRGGVREVDLEQWLFGKDHVCLIRFAHENPMQAIQVGQNALEYVGREYDYGFDKDDAKTIYCSELVYLCNRDVNKTFCAGFIKEEILPQLYYNLCDNKKMFLLFEFKGV